MPRDPWAMRDMSEAGKPHPRSAQNHTGPESSDNAPSIAETQETQSCSFSYLLPIYEAVC